MSRIYKFRAWDKVTKQLSKPLTIGDIQTADVVNWFPHLGWQFNNLTWLQFTGLLDKNGKEIYEGDILLFGMLQYLVRYSAPQFVLSFDEFEKNFLRGQTQEKWSNMEIIGNIYENPELIKDADKV